jgi:flagellar biosynthesis regulator FlaF
MPEWPEWHVREAVGDLAERGRLATAEVPARAGDLAERARRSLAGRARAVVGRFRRSMNMLDLATKDDLETQSRLGRDRVSFVLKEFLDAQREHDAQLRSELREEMQHLAIAIGDTMLAIDDEDDELDLLDRP